MTHVTNAELLAKIMAEIERRIDAHHIHGHFCAEQEFRDVLSFLDTLKPEKPMNQEGLEEEINRYLHEECSDDDEPGIHEIAEHFVEWGYLRAAEKYNEIEYNRQMAEESVPNDLEEAAWGYASKECEKAAFIAGAKWQAEQFLKSSPLPEDTVLFNKGVEEGKRLMMEEFPKWRKIKAGERLPCPAYVWTIAYDNYPDCFEGRLMPNIEGVKVGRDTWYLPVDVIHNLPKEDEK